MQSQSWIVSQTSSCNWNNSYNSSYVYFFPAKIVITNSLEHQVWGGCFWYWDPFPESGVIMLFWSCAHFCSFVHWKWYKKIVNLLICSYKILHAIYWRIGVVVIFQMHQNTTKWKREHFECNETPQREKLWILKALKRHKVKSWKAFAPRLWCHDLFPGTHHFGIAWFPAHSLPHHYHHYCHNSYHDYGELQFWKSDLFALNPPLSLVCGNWQKTFVCVCHASTYRLLSLSIPRTNASSWNLWCNILSNSHLKFTWNSPETSPPRWSRSESWNQNRAGSEIHWKWMVLGNPGKQASRQGGKEGSLLSSTLRNLDTQVSGGGCCRNHHCLNSFPGCKRENFSRPPRKLLKTTIGFSRAD